MLRLLETSVNTPEDRFDLVRPGVPRIRCSAAARGRGGSDGRKLSFVDAEIAEPPETAEGGEFLDLCRRIARRADRRAEPPDLFRHDCRVEPECRRERQRVH